MNSHPIETALAALGVPVARMRYDGKESSYIVYTLLGQTGQIYAEGTEAETGVSFAIALFSPGPDPALMLEAKAALETGGWIVTVDMEYYDHEEDRYQSSLTVSKEGAEYGRVFNGRSRSAD